MSAETSSKLPPAATSKPTARELFVHAEIAKLEMVRKVRLQAEDPVRDF
jgi:hypothetical protein